jgi:hypothetical protein
MAFPYYVFFNSGLRLQQRRIEEDQRRMKEQEFEGVIPPIAEKEKRGKPVKRPKEEPYVRELESKRGDNIPAAD